ncbi:MAG: hypothetical protein K9M57_07290 [Phycisphaerae bacterium]|nr:hypothetical protein [Phycisphaerae bacterium]
MRNRRQSQRYFTRFGLVGCALVALMLMNVGCIHWPDAPFMERVDKLSVENHAALVSAFPKVTLPTAVYRLNMENRWGGYDIVSTQFLFLSEDGQLYHGAINGGRKLTCLEAVYANTLPENLAVKLIQGPNAPLPNAVLPILPWSFIDNSRRIYQFEFSLEGRDGLCTTDSDGSFYQVYFFMSASQ